MHDRLRVHDDIKPVGWQAVDDTPQSVQTLSSTGRMIVTFSPSQLGWARLFRVREPLGAPFAEGPQEAVMVLSMVSGSRDPMAWNKALCSNPSATQILLTSPAHTNVFVGESDRRPATLRGSGPSQRRRWRRPPDRPHAERLPSRPGRRFQPHGRPGLPAKSG